MKIKKNLTEKKRGEPKGKKKVTLPKRVGNIAKYESKGIEIPEGTKMVLIPKFKHVYENEKCIMEELGNLYVDVYVHAQLGDKQDPMMADIIYFKNSKTTPRLAHHFEIIK